MIRSDKITNMTYVNLPLSEGMTLPTALAAPVEEGMMLLLTLRPPRQSFEDGPSTVFWVAVVAWTVVIKPSIIPKLSWTIFANGARQLVVHEALEILRFYGRDKHRLKCKWNVWTYHFVLGVIGVQIDTTHKHGSISGGCRDDNLLGATFQVSRGPG